MEQINLDANVTDFTRHSCFK